MGTYFAKIISNIQSQNKTPWQRAIMKTVDMVVSEWSDEERERLKDLI
jgi:hypothetical protein